MTMSQPSSPFRMSVKVSTPKRSIPEGSRVEGAMSRTLAPIACNRMRFERATLEWRTSPQIATRNPRSGPCCGGS